MRTHKHTDTHTHRQKAGAMCLRAPEFRITCAQPYHRTTKNSTRRTARVKWVLELVHVRCTVLCANGTFLIHVHQPQPSHSTSTSCQCCWRWKRKAGSLSVTLIRMGNSNNPPTTGALANRPDALVPSHIRGLSISDLFPCPSDSTARTWAVVLLGVILATAAGCCTVFSKTRVGALETQREGA